MLFFSLGTAVIARCFLFFLGLTFTLWGWKEGRPPCRHGDKQRCVRLLSGDTCPQCLAVNGIVQRRESRGMADAVLGWLRL